ncbi:MAG: MATE family efflux transporter [Eubacterium sp.]|nr:MATE family efflux transporter [Eubacterium sp.]
MKERNENKMGVMPVKKLLLTMSLPMMISMLVQALYNVVDSYFVAQISEDALTAVTLAFPVQNLMIAIASGTAVGVNALLSKSLGEKNFKTANKTANAGVLLSVLSFLALMIFGLLGTRAFVQSQTDVKNIIELGVDYLQICCCCSIGLFLQVMGERLLQSTGKTIYSMVSQLTGAIINLILDPIMIFGMFGLPKMGVSGAALATVIGQCCAGTLSLILNKTVNKDIELSIKDIMKPDGKVVERIYVVGVPSILMMSIGSVMTYSMNKILIGFSTTATAVFGIYFKLQSFFFMPVFGLNNGLIPILAYNYGARKPERIKEALRFALVLALGVMVTGMLIMKIFPEQLLDIFNASDAMKKIGIPALNIISFNFPIAAVCIALISTFQAFSKSTYSLIVSIMRQLVVLIPVAWLLSKTGEVTNVWWAFPAAELTGLIVTVYLFKRKIYDNIISKL